MTFDEILEQVIVLLQHQKRVAYGALKRRFNLDDAHLEDLKDELIYARQIAVDEGNRVLVWTPPSSLLPETVPVAAQPQVPHNDALQVESPSAERRQLTVMFCDLADSTALASRLDPEDLREAMCMLNTCLQQERGIRLALRVGIHTGPVVVGEMGGGERHEQLALGETPNLAARLQGLAARDTVVASAATLRLVQRWSPALPPCASFRGTWSVRNSACIPSRGLQLLLRCIVSSDQPLPRGGWMR